MRSQLTAREFANFLSRCKTPMKVRKCAPLPGRKFVDVGYRCDECGAEVLRAVPRGR